LEDHGRPGFDPSQMGPKICHFGGQNTPILGGVLCIWVLRVRNPKYRPFGPLGPKCPKTTIFYPVLGGKVVFLWTRRCLDTPKLTHFGPFLDQIWTNFYRCAKQMVTRNHMVLDPYFGSEPMTHRWPTAVLHVIGPRGHSNRYSAVRHSSDHRQTTNL